MLLTLLILGLWQGEKIMAEGHGKRMLLSSWAS